MADDPKVPPAVEPSGEDLLKAAKTEAPVASAPITDPQASAAQPPEPPAAPKANVAKTEAEIQAEVDAFLNTLDKPTRPAAPSPSAPVKSSDGKTVKELIDEGRTAEAIELGSSIAAKAERDRVMAEISHSQVREAFQNKRAQANRKVYLNHPELLDIDRGTKKHSEVPFAAAIKQVYDEYPNLLDAAEGPLMAMEIAEKRLGYKKDNDRAVQSGKTEGAEAEKARQDTARASAALASSSSGAMPPAAPTVTLSDSEKIVAGKLGLTEQDYGTKKGRQTVFNAAYYAKYRGGPKPKR